MSQQLISRSADLKRLQDDGYEIEVRAGHVLVKNVPYVDASRKLRYGILVSTLDLAGDVTTKPSTHVTYFVGEHPCHKDGTAIAKIVNASVTKLLAPGLEVNHTFSSKPAATGSYKDYYDKMTTYVAIISGPAEALDSGVNPRPFRIVETSEDESVFRYIDTASSRAGIGAVAGKLELPKVALVGVGGTGSYVLDLVTKTPVREIHLFDGDRFGSHNAFRSPGAAAVEELRERPMKVDYLAARYSPMHRRIVTHPYYLGKDNAAELAAMDFVFLCMDAGPAKRTIVQALEAADVPFIDVGMGVHVVDGALLGILRVTTSTRDQRDHVRSKDRIPFSGGDVENEYDRNIQVADLNALTAALAVIKWKKLFGFYHDCSQEFFSTYTIDCNMLLSEDRLC
jgi:hypothetical protein